MLVSGATGFIGSRVALRVHGAGHALHAMVREGSDRTRLACCRPVWHQVELEQDDGLDEACRGVDAVVHAAGLIAAQDRKQLWAVNVAATERLARAAARAGVRRFVFVSSLAARGPDGRGTRDDAPEPGYGASKLEAERRLAAVPGEMQRTTLRLAGTYGPCDRAGYPLFALAARGLLALPPAHLRVQPIFVDDVARRIVSLLEGREPLRSGPLPLAEPRSYGWPEAAPLFTAALGRRARVVHLPAAVFRAAGAAAEAWGWLARRPPPFDLRKARDLAVHAYTCPGDALAEGLGDLEATPLAEGLRRTAAWYREHGWL